ncbi:hypothetical protein L1987_53545 [Smallanthus sonchifolius]|uniref:Uncharacterized protein n=1 Tax=Smallanthus sonchifolius TaxID=185202 RepID=A0ACB9EWA4_9ASTR|nr:hypothetical protein L1987_53545 [Smallanthus sonchifolius]
MDTASKSLDWVTSELIRYPRVLEKLQHEVKEIGQGRSMIVEEDLENMKYLKAAIKESLRLHIPAPLLAPRISRQDVKLMGWAIGRYPRSWEEPEEFRPERFLENSISYKGLHFEWLPFGADRRACPGIQFGVAIVELALANIVYKFDLGLPNGVKHEDLDVSEKYGIVLHKKSPLVVTTSPRF